MRADILHLPEYTRQHVVAQIMALAGRGTRNPARFHRRLQRCRFSKISRLHQQLLDPRRPLEATAPKSDEGGRNPN